MEAGSGKSERKRRQAEKLLAASLMAILLSSANLGWAEQPNLAITRESGHINITIDPKMVPDVQIQRNDSQMVINIPKDTDATRLMIESALKNSNTVKIQETDKGKTVTIDSGEVYLNIQDMSQQNWVDASLTKTAKATEKQAIEDDKPKATIDKATKSPLAQATSKIAAVPAKAEVVKQEIKQDKPATIEPVTVRQELAQAAAPEIEQSSALPEDVESSIDAETPEEGTAEPQEIPTEAEVEALPAVDPDAIPLSQLEKQRQVTTQRSSNMLMRVIGSLVVVLLILVWFLKSILPQLMDRYPEFFEGLKQRHAENLAKKHQTEPLAAKPSKFPKPSPKPAKDPKPAAKSSSLEKRIQSDKQQYLEKIGFESDEKFQVLTTQNLGRDKELHLVEIKGRQLVIATTPYTITLIKDVTDEPDADTYLEDDEPVIPTRAYLEDLSQDTPNRKRFSSKREHEQLYKKYLDDNKQEELQNHPFAAPSAYVDAEEVVILEDYDDIYRS